MPHPAGMTRGRQSPPPALQTKYKCERGRHRSTLQPLCFNSASPATSHSCPTSTLTSCPLPFSLTYLPLYVEIYFHKYALISNYWEVMDIATVCRLWNYYIPSFTYRSIFVQRKISKHYSEQHRKEVEKNKTYQLSQHHLCLLSPHATLCCSSSISNTFPIFIA
ncbi:hypothetical protein DL89DRAFT_49244 [Linderina pennispora]|uniref:Uncharacterized protein n=1 Tax=Linderina pennispora TaxID=61395 RepID=A0A1Y1VS83_9FUNG|nr:uncharacterized protein DL89DRAFT_49244 [Linderina pennispora]ORX64127.1 hypothetical protein DL89DRAFT_49244 [Linderina pennispora]